MIMASNSLLSIAFTTVSVIPAADISGFKSYVATFGDGTRIRSSPPNGLSTPPAKRYVTCTHHTPVFELKVLHCNSLTACAPHSAVITRLVRDFLTGVGRRRPAASH